MIDSQIHPEQEPPSANLTSSATLTEALLDPPVLSSKQAGWNGIVVEQYHLRPNDPEFLPLSSHLITLNLGRQGNLEQERDGHVYKAFMAPGSITLTPAGQVGRWHWKHEADVLKILLEPQFVAKVAEASELDASRVEMIDCFGSRDPQIQHIGMSLLAEVKSTGAAGQLYVESLTNLLTIHLLRHHSACKQLAPPITGTPSRLRQAIEYIHDNLEQNIALADLAGVVGLSPYHFTRLFQQETGLAPYQYVIRCRVEAAQRLLTAGNTSVGEVAHRLGFADQSHLTRHFKRIVGVTPKVILQNSKNVMENSTNIQDCSP